jgi:hypothetical protein
MEKMRRPPRCITGKVFPLRRAALHGVFFRVTQRAGLKNFRFHGMRQTAIARMASKLPKVMELEVMGHLSPSILKRHYPRRRWIWHASWDEGQPNAPPHVNDA